VRAYATNESGTSYGNQIKFKTHTGTVNDVDGNVYNTITIGSEIWMRENLKTTKYNDGTPIPFVASDELWCTLSSPGFCWGKDDIYYIINETAYKNIYGALYNWYAVETGKLCPKGWHVPNYDEWTTLTTYLGGDSIAGGKLKETGTVHWNSPNAGATNESGFTALPGGTRESSDFHGQFSSFFLDSIGHCGLWWSSSYTDDVKFAWYLRMDSWVSYAHLFTHYKGRGFSVRCLLSMPQTAKEFYNRGVEKIDLQDYIGAIADFTKIIEIYPKNGDAYHSRGYAKFQLQDSSGAIADFNKVIELNPKNGEAYYLRGLVKIKLGQKDSGCLDLSKAGELGLEEAYKAIRNFCQ